MCCPRVYKSHTKFRAKAAIAANSATFIIYIASPKWDEFRGDKNITCVRVCIGCVIISSGLKNRVGTNVELKTR